MKDKGKTKKKKNKNRAWCPDKRNAETVQVQERLQMKTRNESWEYRHLLS